MRTERLWTLAVVAAVLVGTSGISAAQPAGPDVDVNYEGETISITMTDGSGLVSGLEISVQGAQEAYGDAGTYTANESGSISLPAPESTMTLRFSTIFKQQSLSQEITVEGIAENTPDDDVDLEQGGTGPELPPQIPGFIRDQNPKLSQLVETDNTDADDVTERVTLSLEALPDDAVPDEDFEGEPPENFTDEPPGDFEEDPDEDKRDTDGDGNFDPDGDFDDSSDDENDDDE